MNSVRKAIFEALNADAELGDLAAGIYHQKAPEKAAYPYVLFHKQADTSRWTMRTEDTDQVWLVKGVCRGGDAEEAEDIDARCQAILNGLQLELNDPDRRHEYLARESGNDMSEIDKGETVFHVFSLYRVVVEAA